MQCARIQFATRRAINLVGLQRGKAIGLTMGSKPMMQLPTALRTLVTSTAARSGPTDPNVIVHEEHVVILRPMPERAEETTDIERLRSRLLYQSRKRGIKENDLLMGTFAHNHLQDFNRKELEEYDTILNNHDNEWDMYYWMSGLEPIPDYLKDSDVMKKLVEFSANKNKELRIELPALK